MVISAKHTLFFPVILSAMKFALKIRLSLSSEDKRILDGQSRICNWAYNRGLEKALKMREKYVETKDPDIAKILYSERGLRNFLPHMKTEHPFLKTVHSSPLKNAMLRLSSAIRDRQKARKGLRRGKIPGFPKFRSSRKWFSLLYDEPGKGFKVQGKSLRLSLGQNEGGKRLRVEARLEKSVRDFGVDRVLNLRITSERGDYYAVFGVEKSEPRRRQIRQFVALDPNHKNLAHGVDSEGGSFEIANPWFLKQLDKRIDALKGKRDRCVRKSELITRENGRQYWRPSRRWRRTNDALDRLYKLRRDQTKSFLYTVANKLFKIYDHVGIGDYTPRGGGINKGMRRSMNNQSLIGRFKEVLSWVAQRGGKSYGEWSEYNSTSVCFDCGHKSHSLTPNDRQWDCDGCGTHHFRDENSGRHGVVRVAKQLQMPCSGHLDISLRCAWRFCGLGIVVETVPGFADGKTAQPVGAVFKGKLNSGYRNPVARFAEL